MGNLLWPVKSRVRMAFLSALVIAIISAFFSFTPAAKQGMNLVSHTLAQAAAGTGATATPTSGGQGSNGASGAPAPTATPIPSPTTAPPTPTPKPTSTPKVCPTPSPTPSGQTLDLHGTITSVNTTASTFSYTVGGCPMTVHVNDSTTYEGGGATSLAGLNPGWSAEVTGIYRADLTFLAYTVHQDN